MFIVFCFTFIFCYSYVCVFLVGVFLYDCSLVNNSLLKAFAVKGARVFLSTVANFVVIFCSVCWYCFIVNVGNLLNVIHTTVAQFYLTIIIKIVTIIV